MLFDARAELPIATLNTPSLRDRAVAALRGRLRWIRPRLVPIAVAIIGTSFVGISASYLFGLTQPEPGASGVAPPAVTSPAPAAVEVALRPR
jgi:hypothetical protein